MRSLREKVFRGWPGESEAGPIDIDRAFSEEVDGVRLTAFDFTSQPNVRLRLFCVEGGKGDGNPSSVRLNILDEVGWTQWLATMRSRFEKQLSAYTLPEANPSAFEAMRAALEADKCPAIYFCPRGIGPDAWSGDEKKQIQIRRRFMLLGQTADGMRVWDVRRAVQALRLLDTTAGTPVTVTSQGDMAGIVLYASLFESDIRRLDLVDLPPTHAKGPTFLNVLRFLDTPPAVAMAAERVSVQLHVETAAPWQFPQSVAARLGWDREHLNIDACAESQASQ